MICVSIINRTLEEIFSVLERQDIGMAEIRLDKNTLSDSDIENLFASCGKPLIATCRASENLTEEKAARRLGIAIEAGADYADMDLTLSVASSRKLTRLCRDNGVFIIRSLHDFESTPDESAMLEAIARAKRYGADIVKIAVTARSEEDCKRVMGLYDHCERGRLIAFAMGKEGRQTRLDALKNGAPFSYCALNEGEAAAPGQWTNEEMVYELGAPSYHRGRISVNCSKSFAQRAIIAAALCKGETVLHGYSPCGDNESAIEAARRLGARIHSDTDGTLHILGGGKPEGPISSIHAGESGLLARLLIPLCAALGDGPITISGEGTLPQRPLSGAADIMAAFGVMTTNEDTSHGKEIHVPLRLSGRLMPGKADISGKGGSQLISGLLMALPLMASGSTVYVHDPKSIPYMFMTLDVLKKFGIKVDNEMEGDEEFVESGDWGLCTSINFFVKGAQEYSPAEFVIEADWSSAAVFLVAGAIFGSVSISGMDTRSLQADLTIIDILSDAGASVSEDEDGTINSFQSPLYAFDEDLNNAPDLFPVVAVLAAFSAGTSHILGLGRLYSKESNRSEAILEILSGLGVEAYREGDCLIINGIGLSERVLTGNLLKGGSFRTRGDHRLVMALKLAALGASGPVVLDDEDCVGKSYPDFISQFAG